MEIKFKWTHGQRFNYNDLEFELKGKLAIRGQAGEGV